MNKKVLFKRSIGVCILLILYLGVFWFVPFLGADEGAYLLAVFQIHLIVIGSILVFILIAGLPLLLHWLFTDEEKEREEMLAVFKEINDKCAACIDVPVPQKRKQYENSN